MLVEADSAGLLEGVRESPEAEVPYIDRQRLGELAAGGVVFFGGGDNFFNMGEAVQRLARQHPVYIVEHKKVPEFDLPRDQVFLVSDTKEEDDLHALLDSGKIDFGYVGLPPGMHEQVAEEHLERIGKGLMRYLVVTKPVVPDIKSLKRLDEAVVAAYAERQKTRPDLHDPIIYVHEHYIEKGAWRALREQLPAVADRLGRMRSFTVNIGESQIIEDEKRGLDAFGEGALGDFGPHTASIAINAKDAVNKSERWEVSNHTRTETRLFRYDGTQLPYGVPTGFVVKGRTTVKDKLNGSEEEMHFVWRAGKGLGVEDKKYVEIEFENDDGVVSTIYVDLKHNYLQFSKEVPQDVRDLFETVAFTENGYGPIVEQGLNGGGPYNSFQPWEQARDVTKWMAVLQKQAKGKGCYPYPLNHGFELSDLEDSAFARAVYA